MNRYFDLGVASMGRLGSGDDQGVGTRLHEYIRIENLKHEEARKEQQEERKKELYSMMWQSGYKEGRKIKVHLHNYGDRGYTYKITYGRGHKPIYGKWLVKDPVKAIESGYRRVTAIWGNE